MQWLASAKTILTSTATIVTGVVGTVSLAIALWQKVQMERAAEKARATKDTTDLDKSLGG